MKPMWRYVLGIVAVVITALVWLVGTESGLQWALARARAALPGELTMQAIHGRLIGPISVEALHVRSESSDVRVARLELDWTPAALLLGNLRVTRLHAQDVEIALTPAQNESGTAHFPLSLTLVDARIDGLRVRRGSGTEPFELARLDVAASMGRERLRLSRLHLEHASATIDVNGPLVLGTDKKIDGDLHWAVRTSGGPAFEGHGSIRSHTTGITATQKITAPLSAQLDVTVQDIDTRLRWSAQLKLAQQMLNRMQPRWPALRLAGNAEASGNLEALQAQVTLEAAHEPLQAKPGQLQATLALRRETNTARGVIDAHWRDLAWPVEKNLLASPRGELHLRGTLDDYALQLTTALRDDNHLTADAQLTGRGNRQSLRVTALRVATLDGDITGSGSLVWSPQPAWQAQLHGQDLNPGRMRAQWPGRVGFDIDGRGTFEHVQATLKRADGILNGRWFALRGAVAADHAGIQLRQLELRAPRARVSARGVWRPPAMELTWDLHAEDLALLAPQAAGAITSRGEIRGTRRAPRVSASLDGRGLAFDSNRVELVHARANVDTNASQIQITASGVNVFGIALGQTSARADGELARHQIRVESIAPEARFDLDATGTYADGTWHGTLTRALLATRRHGQWRTEQPAALTASAHRLRLETWCWRHDRDRLCSQAHWERERALQGRVTVEARDLAPLTALIPQIEQARGRLHADLQVNGSPAQPRVTGSATLTQAALRVPRLGIDVRDIDLRLRPAEKNVLTLSGRARSGKGVLDVSGRVAFEADKTWNARLRFKGSEFEVANTTELQLPVSPDLTLDARPRRLHLAGNVHIPRAEIRPRKTAGATLPSADVTYVDTQQKTERWEITTRVRLTLGDAVHVDGFNFDGHVNGDVLIEEQSKRQASARGELRVASGQYTVQDRVLIVERGRLTYTGSPLDDPWLDVRAMRRVGEVAAGVQARGTLKNPQLTLVSEPAMNDTDILSYIILGHPISQASAAEGQALFNASSAVELAGGEMLAKRLGAMFGIEEVRIDQQKQNQTALVLGKYLSPRLYVSYGVGLLETADSLRLRYQLGRHWQIQTETGEASGADLLYTIER